MCFQYVSQSWGPGLKNPRGGKKKITKKEISGLCFATNRYIGHVTVLVWASNFPPVQWYPKHNSSPDAQSSTNIQMTLLISLTPPYTLPPTILAVSTAVYATEKKCSPASRINSPGLCLKVEYAIQFFHTCLSDWKCHATVVLRLTTSLTKSHGQNKVQEVLADIHVEKAVH